MELIDIKGIGKATIEKLKLLNINSVKDLSLYLPVTYIDMNNYSDMKSIENGNYYLFRGKILKINKISRGRRVNYFKATAISDSVTIRLLWYNQPYMYDKLQSDEEYSFFGKISIINNEIIVNNPTFEPKGGETKLRGILPIYKTNGLIHQATLRKIILSAMESEDLISLIDDSALKKAIYDAHKPINVEDGNSAIRRIAIEDIVNTVINFRINKTKFTIDKDRKYIDTSIDRIVNSLEYELTDTQKTAIAEIIEDMKSDIPMNRLLLGDVGSGKTIVSMLAIYVAAINKIQSLCLVPTTILARQHYRNSSLLTQSGINVRLLTSDTTVMERKIIIEELGKGAIDLLIGTHSILSDEIVFHNLGLIITDEFHRFGVGQKSHIETKGNAVDTLVMSATPIPRALSLTLYEDLKVSRIDRRGDIKIKTNIVTSAKKEDMFNFLLNEINNGRQGYIVCSNIEDVEGIEISSAKSIYEELRKGQLKDIKLECLYGSMKEEKKTAIMQQFREGSIDVLISTTVIEVGIDVPNASIMIIMNAERFGLATLHQLRGRVGRGASQSYCLLFTDKGVNDRLNALKSHSNGADIADIDYELRGGGDFIGLKQSGKCNYRYKITKEMIIEAKRIADSLLINDNLIEKFNRIKNDDTDCLVRKVTMN